MNANTKNTLIQQCNHWFSEYKRLSKHKTSNNENLMIEALGCAKGVLCLLKELDNEDASIYEDFINDINYKLKEIYKTKIEAKLKYNSLLHNIDTKDSIHYH